MNHRLNHPPQFAPSRPPQRQSAAPVAAGRPAAPRRAGRGTDGSAARRWAAGLLVGATTWAGGAAVARGQAVAPAGPAAATATRPAVPPAPSVATMIPLKALASVGAPQQATIAAFVNGQFRVLTVGDPGAAKAAREALEAGATGSAAVATSPGYQTAYAAAVSAAAVKALADPDVRTRVNAAVAVARVAVRMPNGGLAPAVLAALADKADAVQLWGVKAARYVYPALLGVIPKQADAIATAVIGAVRAHGTSVDRSAEPIAEEAFAALAGDLITNAAVNPAAAARFKDATPNILRLLRARVELYQAAQPGMTDTYPPLTNLDSAPFGFLSVTFWRPMAKPQQQAAMQVMLDLATEMVRLAPFTPPKQPGPQEGVFQNDLSDLLTKSLQTIQVAASAVPNAPVAAAAQAAWKLVNANLNPGLLNPALAALQQAMAASAMLPPPPPAAPPAAAPAGGTPAGRPAAPGAATLNK